MPAVLATKRRWIRIAVVLLATAFGLEIGSRVVDRLHGKPFDAESARASIEDVCRTLTRSFEVPGQATPARADGRATDLLITQPYVGWEHPRTQAEIAKDCAYYRGPEAAAAFDLCILGGSVAQTFADLGAPALMKTLRKDARFAKRPIRVHNYALAAFKEPQLATMLAYLFALGHEPDAVVVIDGFNEAALGWNNASLGVQPLYPHALEWTKVVGSSPSDPVVVDSLVAVRAAQERARSFGTRFLESGLWRSCFLYHAGTVVLEKLRANYVAVSESLSDRVRNGPKDPSIRGPDFEAEESRLVEAIARAWFQSSISIQGMCSQRGTPYLHVLQPTMLDPGSKPLTAKEIELGTMDPTWVEGVHRLYPRFRELGRDFVLHGVPFFDASGIFREHPEDVYFDGCHFAEHGNRILGEAVGAELARVVPR